jgi:hypothetical protein
MVEPSFIDFSLNFNCDNFTSTCNNQRLLINFIQIPKGKLWLFLNIILHIQIKVAYQLAWITRTLQTSTQSLVIGSFLSYSYPKDSTDIIFLQDVLACFVAVWNWHIQIQHNQIKQVVLLPSIRKIDLPLLQLNWLANLLVSFKPVLSTSYFKTTLCKHILLNVKLSWFVVSYQASEFCLNTQAIFRINILRQL